MEGNKQVEITQIVGGNSRSRPYYSRRCKRTIRLSVTIECIPDEILFDILLRLSAQDIYHAARLVCRKWYHITRTKNFIHTHLHHATYGLLFHDEQGSAFFVSVREGEIERYKLMNYKFRCLTWTSCNGLVLEHEKHSNNYVIANLSTDKAFCLPPYPRRMIYPILIGIGYVATSLTYKVFATHDAYVGERSECGILTVGVDKSWRFISTHHLSLMAKFALRSSPLINEGFMHWQSVGTQVVTLNVETEIITETSPPIHAVVMQLRRSHFLFSTGRYLSLLISHGELVWEVWEMKPETGEWRKLPEMRLCLENQKGRMEELGLKKGDRIIPCGWVKYPEILALKIVGRFVCFYNLVKREICSENIIDNCLYKFVLHKNSLVPPVGWRMLS